MHYPEDSNVIVKGRARHHHVRTGIAILNTPGLLQMNVDPPEGRTEAEYTKGSRELEVLWWYIPYGVDGRPLLNDGQCHANRIQHSTHGIKISGKLEIKKNKKKGNGSHWSVVVFDCILAAWL